MRLLPNSAALALLLCFAAGPALAATRSCTEDERTAADARLLALAQDEAQQKKLIKLHLKFGVPHPTGPTAHERILVQDGYVMDHDEDLRTALWVGYRLTATDQEEAGGQGRVNCFRKDPRLPDAAAAFPADYTEPRYDQGHLANDADLKDDLTDQINTYVMSNMSPQECRFNRGIWLSLESLTRVWATEYGTVYVTSGAIFDRDGDNVRDDDAAVLRMKSNSGKRRVAVPSHYFKIILRQQGERIQSIAFLLKQTRRAHGTTWAEVRPDVERGITTIEAIEDKSDLTLFPDLDREKIRQSSGGEDWAMDGNAANLESGCSN